MAEDLTQPLHIAVCDDEPADCQEAEKPANEIMAAEGLACGFCSCESAASLLAAAPKRAH